MRGPFLLRPLHVDLHVPARIGGVYCLAKDSKHVSVVSRAECNLRTAIKSHWGDFEFFWYQPTLTTRECYVNQCHEYHKRMDNGGLDEEAHPASPVNVDVTCPVCGN